ncbi:MAG: RNA polymerase sigma-54 factor [Acidobacteria bacterium]|nr:MAG: RNA polymerase sigma-54 factor [Acidobacteriota bacterium]PYV72833.1 MAG: RNA polymerase sigma-54 factor [Acidobacteriota bacterium]
MVLLQPKLQLRVSQRQILTPGLVQMVSVLALNKLELKDMITAEMVENPVLEELEDSVPLIDDVGRREEERERAAAAEESPAPEDKKDPFEEIDFGSFFKDYLDPGFRSQGDFEEIERPSFENFLSRPSTLTDHLVWQLGSIPTTPPVREAAELVIGNLNEDGYLIASDEELLGIAPPAPPEVDAAKSESVVKEAVALGLGPSIADEPVAEDTLEAAADWAEVSDLGLPSHNESSAAVAAQPAPVEVAPLPVSTNGSKPAFTVSFNREQLHEAIEIVRQLDPPGVACRDLRECLLYQLRYHQAQLGKNGNGSTQVLADAVAIVDQHLRALQNRQHKEISRAIARPVEAVQSALEYIRTLDPRPGQQYNKVQPRLIEPDVAFVKHGDEWLVMMNDDDVPTLRLNPAYKRLLTKDGNDRDTRNYVKERFKSAIQLIKNIEQRKQTILKVCYTIVTRQRDFLERGIDELKPMMIKEVAEEIGVHPSTVSRAVASKYAHTPQGVFELRYFFSESVNGPEGGNTSLLILKRRVKKLIEDEDPAKPLTDEQITRILQSQGIQVTRRTVAKYREDMKIPSTHQRRVKK